jgi:hypothetical protein
VSFPSLRGAICHRRESLLSDQRSLLSVPWTLKSDRRSLLSASRTVFSERRSDFALPWTREFDRGSDLSDGWWYLSDLARLEIDGQP